MCSFPESNGGLVGELQSNLTKLVGTISGRPFTVRKRFAIPTILGDLLQFATSTVIGRLRPRTTTTGFWSFCWLPSFQPVNTIGSHPAVRTIQEHLPQLPVSVIIGRLQPRATVISGFPLVSEFSADRTSPTIPDPPTSLLSAAPPYDDDYRDDCVASRHLGGASCGDQRFDYSNATQRQSDHWKNFVVNLLMIRRIKARSESNDTPHRLLNDGPDYQPYRKRI